MIARNGALADLISAGARMLESACGPCIGMGQSPKTNAVSIRTFNHNFEGRSGTKSAEVYLAGPEVAVASAIFGVITDPRKLGEAVSFEAPEKYLTDDRMVIRPWEIPSLWRSSAGLTSSRSRQTVRFPTRFRAKFC